MMLRPRRQCRSGTAEKAIAVTMKIDNRARNPVGLFNRRLSAAQFVFRAESLTRSAGSQRSADALYASPWSARRRARFAKCALHPALCLTIANRWAGAAHRRQQNRTAR